MEKQILEVVLNIQANQIEMQKQMQRFEQEQQSMKAEMQGFKEEQQSMKAEMQGFKEEQQSMKAEQQGLKQQVETLLLLRRQDSINIAKILEVQTKQFQEMRNAM